MKGFRQLIQRFAGILVVGLGLLHHGLAQSATLDDIDFVALPGNEFEMRLMFSEPPAQPQSYTIERPARIVLDFEDVKSVLEKKKHALSFENAKSAVVLTAGNRTRVILNLSEAAPFSTDIQGNVATVRVGGTESAVVASSTPAAPAGRPATEGRSIQDVDFSRTADGAGNIVLDLSTDNVSVDVTKVGNTITASFYRTSLPAGLDRRLDVVDFATPVKAIDTTTEGTTTKVSVEATGDYDYLAYQADDRYVISVKPLTPAELEEQKAKFDYTGEKLSLNFQDIPVRSVLQLIADFTDLNLVASDTVTGNITLRLQNVPWDQALDIVLKAKGLDKRVEGNVLMVAPAAEIAEQERLKVEANKQLQELAPLVTEFIRVRYADAGELFELFRGGGGGGGGRAGRGDESLATGSVLSNRGSAIVDERTNTIIITDTEDKIEEFKRLVKEIDIPVRQVEIEARIVIANTDFRRELGVRWGVQGAGQIGDAGVGVGGSLENFGDDVGNPLTSFPTITNYNPASPAGQVTVNEETLAVDLGVANPFGSFAVELLTDNAFLDLELSALENTGYGEVVSQPKVMTGDKQTAVIKSGEEIAYQEATSSGATNVEFKEAVLSLEVTPQITPDNRVILDLIINQDSVGQRIIGGEPSIDVTEIQTQALVGDGQTLVLGGIFQMEDNDSVDKVPVLGDIPYVGRLFKRKARANQKREILIFVTPRIIEDRLLDR
jgi:type IV pilus assembly protein PilQ